MSLAEKFSAIDELMRRRAISEIAEVEKTLNALKSSGQISAAELASMVRALELIRGHIRMLQRGGFEDGEQRDKVG